MSKNCLHVFIPGSEMKMEEEHDTILRYVQLKPEGASTNQKRSLRRKSEKFVIRDGLLYYSSSGTLRQWISSKEKQNQVIAACHTDNLGGHLGGDKTRDKITTR